MQFDLFEKKQISNFVACIVITLFCFLLYGKTLSYGITMLDDTALISQGASFSLKNLLTTGAISADTNLAYRPFLNLSFAADYLLNGLNPACKIQTHIRIFQNYFYIHCSFPPHCFPRNPQWLFRYWLFHSLQSPASTGTKKGF